MKIANLHSHSEFSNFSAGFIDSSNKLEEMLEFAFDSGMKGIGITDHESVTAHIRAFEWWQKKIDNAETEEEKERAKNFKVVLGNEIYIAREGLNSENHQTGENFFHFLLLARDKKGQAQLRELSTMAWEKAYMKSVMRRFNYMSELEQVIKPDQGHVVATTACIANMAGYAFLNLPREEAETTVAGYIDMLINIFGEDNLYVELSPALYPEQIEYNKFMYNLYKDQLPFIITNDVHYLTKDDFRTLELLMGEGREIEKYYKYAYFMTWEEITKNMNYLPLDFLEGAAQNALDIAASADIYDLKNPQEIPVVPHKTLSPSEEIMKEAKQYKYIERFLKSEHEPDRVMASQVLTRFAEKEETTSNRRKLVFERLNKEWEELWGISETLNTRLSNYLLTMSWMIEKMWETGTLVGPGRGSAVAFATNYYLDITDVNPLDYPLNIPHWRFISSSRVELPDIDIDTPGADRQLVLNKLTEEFQALGGDVVQVATYGTATTKSALRTIGRGLGIPGETMDYITSLVPSERGRQFSLKQTYYGDEDHPPVKAFVEQMNENQELWEHAQKVEGLVVQMGVHAGGIILSNNPIHKNNSIMKTKQGVRVTAYNLHESEDTGLIKYDVLSVDALSKLKVVTYLLLQHNKIDWQGSLKDTFQHYFSPRNLKPTDEVWENIAAGRVNSLFQLSTPVGQAAVRLLHVKSIEEAGMVNSLMRLQPQSTGERQPLQVFAEYREDIQKWYAELRRFGLNQEEIKIMEDHLLPLNGVADTQEIVMLMSMDERISGFTVAEANFLRKSVARIDPVAQAEVKELFYIKGAELGTRRQLLDYVWNVQIRYSLG